MSESIDKRDISGFLSVKSELESVKNDFVLVRKELGDVAYQLSLLYDRWGAEHQIVSRREADMLRVIESFNEQVSELEQLQTDIQENITKATIKAASQTAHAVSEEVKRYFVSTISDTVVKLSNQTRQIEAFTKQYESVHDASSVKTFIMGIVVVFIIGVAVGYFAF